MQWGKKHTRMYNEHCYWIIKAKGKQTINIMPTVFSYSIMACELNILAPDITITL